MPSAWVSACAGWAVVRVGGMAKQAGAWDGADRAGGREKGNGPGQDFGGLGQVWLGKLAGLRLGGLGWFGLEGLGWLGLRPVRGVSFWN